MPKIVKKIVLSKKDQDRFKKILGLIDTRDNTKCWNWPKYCFKRRGGYGRFLIKDRPFYAHRISFCFFFNDDPLELVVCHSCDNPKCINPSHLFKGTPKDNMSDMIKKGRKAKHLGPNFKIKGSLHGRSKLKEDDVLNIRKLVLIEKIPQRQVAFRYKISPATVCNIIKNKNWGHLNENKK